MGNNKIRNITITTGPLTPALKELLRGKPVVTHTILFEIGTATLNSESEKFLGELVQLLKDHPTLKLNIYRHTDNTGSDTDNLILSDKRAAAVKNALVAKGVNGSRLNTKGLGASKPLKTGNSAEARALNRRVEFVPQ